MNLNEILEAAREKGGDRFVSKKALNLTIDGKVVDEDDEKGRYVLCGAGGTLSTNLAKSLGLLEQPELEIETEPEKQTEDETQSKAVKPGQNKAIKQSENK